MTDSKFLFYPVKVSFIDSYLETLIDFLSGAGSLHFVGIFLKELMENNIIAANSVKEHSFNLGTSVFHDVYIQNYDGTIYSRGTSKNREEAYAKAVGEIFERQCTQFPEIGIKTVVSSILNMHETKKSFVDPKIYSQPTNLQKQKLQSGYLFDDSTIFEWIEVKDFITGKSIYILKQDAYWGGVLNGDEPYVSNMSTHGCGGGYSLQQAEESAVLEVVQRDTFFTYWYFNRRPKKIILETLPKGSEVFKTVEELQKKSFTVVLLDMTEVAGLPTITCILYKETTGWFLGASTSFSKLQAIERSIQEAFSTYMWVFQTVKNGGYLVDSFLKNEPKKDFLDSRIGSKERCLLWGSKWYKDKQDQFLIEGDFVPFSEQEDTSNFSLKGYIKNKYKECYINYISNHLLSNYDYFVVKVVAPKAFSLFLTEKATLAFKDNTYPHNTTIHPFP